MHKESATHKATEAHNVYDNGEDLVSRTQSVASPAQHENIARKITPSRIPGPSNLNPSRADEATGLQRRKAGRISNTKLGAPRQHRPLLLSRLPSRPAALEKQVITAGSGSQAASVGLAMPVEPVETPPTISDEERARLADFTLFPTEDPFTADMPIQLPVDNTIRPALYPDPPSEDCFRPQMDKHDDPDALAPFPESPRKPIPPVWKPSEKHGHRYSSSQDTNPDEITPISPLTIRKNVIPRHASTASWKSNATFSTPGRDEMERKKGHLYAMDEGPFGAAKGMQELAEKRRQVSEGKSVSQRFEEAGEREKKKKKKKGEGEGGGLCRCVMM